MNEVVAQIPAFLRSQKVVGAIMSADRLNLRQAQLWIMLFKLIKNPFAARVKRLSVHLRHAAVPLQQASVVGRPLVADHLGALGINPAAELPRRSNDNGWLGRIFSNPLC